MERSPFVLVFVDRLPERTDSNCACAKTLELQLSANRLANMNKLAELYKTVDKDGNGTLDFSE